MQKRYNQEAPDTYISNGINGLPNVISRTFAVTPAISGKDFWNLNFVKDGEINIGSFGEWTLTALDTFTATVKMWGAGGARGYASNQSITSTSLQGNGGSAGYSTATITFRRGQKYIIQVGQGGSRTTTIKDGATYLSGGVGVTFGGTEGGGYTGLFIDSVSQGNVMLIAGGGGAGGDTTFNGTGGAGGGITGGNAVNTSQGGSGGTLLAGGASGGGNGPTAGTALRGGKGQINATSQASEGGGGGGYFGGGGGNVGGGGGGSGRIGLFADVTSGTTTAGSGNTVANDTDADRAGAGQGGNATIGNTGSDGRLIIRL